MSDYEGQRLLPKLHKADYQREFYDLLNALEQTTDPVNSPSDLLSFEYDPEEGGLPNGSLKFVVGLGLFYLDTTSVAIVDGVTVLATGLATGRWLKYTTGGGGGGSGNCSEETVSFGFSAGGLGVLTTLNPGDVISDVRISVTVPFNGVGAEIRLGTATNPSQFFGFTDTRLDRVLDYEVNPVFISPFIDQLIFLLNTAGSTAGQGVIYYRIRRI